MERRSFRHKSSMKKVNVVLVGLGHVGRAFLRLIQEKEWLNKNYYGIEFIIKAVFNSKGAFVFPDSLEGQDVKGIIDQGLSNSDAFSWKPNIDLNIALHSCKPGALVECTPSDGKTGEPGLTHIRKAFDAGWHVVTANKGPLVKDYRGLLDMARRRNLELKISGATAAALPTLDVALYSLAGTDIQAIEAILNGTTNYILTRMMEGKDYETSLREAQAKGIAETDPSNDVEGWDTSYKLVLITNAIFDTDIKITDVRVEGIKTVSSSLIEAARKEGKALKLLGRMKKKGADISLEVGIHAIEKSHSLFNVDGTNKGITYFSDSMGAITVHGGQSDPRGAAAALLKDLLNIYWKE
jgi:homoserine dehydrogenase